MFQYLKRLFRDIRSKRFSYEPLVTITLNSDAVLHNYKTFGAIRDGMRIAPVLKSNAYGHGLALIAKKLDAFNPPFFVVDSYYEALLLKNEEIRSDVLVLGYTKPENIFKAKKKGIIFAITTLSQLEKLSADLKRSTRFHLKIDTGMHRQGIVVAELSSAVALIKKNKNILLEGICSHFADADGQDASYTHEQIKVWNEISETIRKEFLNLRYVHSEATAGTMYAREVYANVSRIGLGLYGIDSASDRTLLLIPVLSMKSNIVGVKELHKGECVGYNATYCASHDIKIATVPAGYYEGVDRRLSNKGSMYIRGVECPIVGRVSMNMTSIDISDVPGVKEGDAVEIISANAERKNSVISMARLCETIPYEILVHIPEKIRRIWK